MEKTILNNIATLEYYKIEDEDCLRSIVQKRKDRNKDEKQKILIEKQDKCKHLINMNHLFYLIV